MRTNIRHIFSAVIIALCALSLTACAPMRPQQNTSANPNCVNNTNVLAGVAGALVGGVVGSRFGSGGGRTAATVAGVAGGTMMGNSLGCQ